MRISCSLLHPHLKTQILHVLLASFYSAAKPVIEPYGDSKSNTEVFRLLAGAMGFTEQELQDSDEELIRQALDFPDNPYIEDIDYEALSRHSFMKAKRKTAFSGKAQDTERKN